MGKSKELAELGQVVSQSGGNVGIGADSPTEALHIAKAFPAVKLDNIDVGGHSWRIASGSTNSGFAGKLQIYNEDTSTIAAYIDASGRVTMPYQPSFKVGMGTTFSSQGQYNPIVFTDTSTTAIGIHNRGNHYNSSNGVFTAPVAGVYFFQSNVLAQGMGSGNNVEMFFISSGGLVAASERKTYYPSATGWGDGYLQMKISVSTYLSANDNFYVSWSTNDGTPALYAGSASSNFSGYLLG